MITIDNFLCCFSLISVAVIKHSDQKQRRVGKGLFSFHFWVTGPFIEGSQGRNSRKNL